MMNKGKMDRRDFIKGAAITGAGLALGGGLVYARRALAGLLAGDQGAIDQAIRDHKQELISDADARATVAAYMNPEQIDDSRVVHVRDAGATDWDGSGWYGDAVDQTTVDTMVQQGLQTLTGESSWADIWNDLFSQVQPSGYQPGHKIAIKVNFNNSWNGGCSGAYSQIDALPQPVKALIAGLVGAGVNQDDVWIYDATKEGRIIPNRFRTPILSSYPGVQFYGKGDCSGVIAVSHGGHSSLTVRFSDPHGNLGDRYLTDVLYNATYLINMPILKAHSMSPVTLGFKNHFGSIQVIIGGGNDDLHNYIRPASSFYSSTYSPMVDIFQNTNIKDKTILTAGDGLYGAFSAVSAPPTSWNTFGDAPNSLFFSKDPVAIDCVMTDFLVAEGKVGDDAYDTLFCAEEVGLGVCEGARGSPGGDPWQTPYGSGYSDIQYIRIGP
jgi:hypothetical protein